MLSPPEPVVTVDLFPEERAALLDVLSHLTNHQWHAPTACDGWNVKDVVAHLLGVELAKLSRARDGYYAIEPRPDEDLGTFVNRINREWVLAFQRISPSLLCELLAESGVSLFGWFETLDMRAPGPSIAWAGPEPRPVWLDIAREYTERWHHQQHIREAVGVKLLSGPRFMAPVLATFAWSLPESLREAEAGEGDEVQVNITGPSGGAWTVRRQAGRWELLAGWSDLSVARVSMDEDVAWRLFTNGISRADAENTVRLDGDIDLGRRILNAVAIIA